jgi:two-component system chemotaxis response regulator CheB
MTDRRWEAIVIGGSAGALRALSTILPALPADFPLPIMAVVHLPPDKQSVLAEVLQAKCAMRVREAQDKEPIEPGTIYFAPPDYHLLVEDDRHFALSYDAPQLFSRPSIDVLFESAVDVYADRLIGIVLSGANNDGALGLEAVDREGGLPLVQSPKDAHSTAMPLAALAKCPTAQALSAEQIASFLKSQSHESET